MRRRRTLIVLALALVSGALAGYAALQLMQQQPSTVDLSRQGGEATQVVVAAVDIPVGHRLAEEDIKLAEWPADILPEGYARTKADVLGRGVIQSLLVNEPVLERNLADRAGGVGLAIRIEEGMRALTIRVNQLNTVAGYWQPGTRTDLLLWIAPPGGGEPVARTVKQNIVLLSADAMTEMNPDGQPVNYTLATLLVTPEDAEDIVMLQQQGDLTMTLRNTLDLVEIETVGSGISRLWRELRGGRAPVARRTTTAPTPTPTTDASAYMTIIRGNDVSRVGRGGGER